MYYDDAYRVYEESGIDYEDATASVDPPAARVSVVDGADRGSRFALSFSTGVPITLYDPAELYRQCLEADPPVPVDSFWGKANSFTVPLGSEPGIGYFLVSYGECVQYLESALAEAQALRTSCGVTLSLKVYDVSGNFRQADNLYVTRWECVTPGHPTDDNSLYVVTVRDIRSVGLCGVAGWLFDATRVGSIPFNPQGHTNEYPPNRSAFNIPKANAHGDGGNNRWFLPPTTKSSVSPAGVMDDSFWPPTAVSGGNLVQSLWSWAEMLTLLGLKNILWQGGGGYNYLSPVTLPYTPPLPPIDFDFSDVSEWMAVAAVLDRLSLALKFNPFARVATDSGFLPVPTLCVIGKEDPDRDAALSSIAAYLVWDRRGQDVGAPAPYYVRSKYFPFIARTSATVAVSGGGGGLITFNYWASLDNERTQQQFWNGAAGWAIGADSAYAPAANNSSGIIDHDVPFIGHSPGLVNPNYSVTAILESVNRHLMHARQSTLSARSLNRIYAGFHTADGLLPGSMVKLIRWEDCGRGPRTHIYCGDGYLPPHALYHLVNPHRLHRTDDLRRWQSVEGLDVSKL